MMGFRWLTVWIIGGSLVLVRLVLTSLYSTEQNALKNGKIVQITNINAHYYNSMAKLNN